MKRSPILSLFRNRKWSRDRIPILLLLVFGITGQLFVFLIPDPLRFLAPRLPILTPRDWPGSSIGTELFFTDNWRMSNRDPWRPFLWEEKRGFYQSLYLSPDIANAYIDQTIVWYADPDENAGEWSQLDPDTYNGWPIIQRSMEPDQPVSILACNPDSPPQCWYLAYWDHWFTGVFFWRQFDEDLLIQDIDQLTARVNQLLISAPDEPCFWFLCTNNHALASRFGPFQHDLSF